jgi:hypothetical protein
MLITCDRCDKVSVVPDRHRPISQWRHLGAIGFGLSLCPVMLPLSGLLAGAALLGGKLN